MTTLTPELKHALLCADVDRRICKLLKTNEPYQAVQRIQQDIETKERQLEEFKSKANARIGT